MTYPTRALFFAILVCLAACGGAQVNVPTDEVAATQPKPLPTQPESKLAEPTNTPYAPPDVPSDVATIPNNAMMTASGLGSRVIRAGTGTEHPGERDTVKVHYRGWTTDGHKFDGSWSRGRPTSFPLDRVIPGWTEGVQLMVVGEVRRLWIPEKLAYEGRPGAPQGMLVFDVELISIKPAPKPPPVPADVAGIPDDAEVTASGLASRVLKQGDGDVRPSATDTVTVRYAGWTTDGVMFDNSMGRTVTFPLDRVIPGWTEGVQLMVEGEKRRFWIPADLAYGDDPRPGAPKGMLVFDVELVEVEVE